VPRATRILVVDDEEHIRFLLSEELAQHGYDVSTAAGGEEAVAMLHREEYDLMLLDLKMPGMDGLQVMGEAHKLAPNTVVIMLTGHATLDSAIAALRQGGHDYLTKPSSTEEILCSVEKGLSRRQRSLRQEELIRQMGDIARQLADRNAGPMDREDAVDERARYLRAGDLLIDRVRLSVTSCGETVHFTPSEYRLLLCLMENAGRTVSFRGLAEAIHGPGADESGAKDAISTHIWRLRRRLENAPGGRTHLVSVRGEGYALRTQPE
jgi:DNA-binding response OmpR family regulator